MKVTWLLFLGSAASTADLALSQRHPSPSEAIHRHGNRQRLGPHFGGRLSLSKFNNAAIRIVGGSQEKHSSSVSVNPNESLPGSFKGASLAAFAAGGNIDDNGQAGGPAIEIAQGHDGSWEIDISVKPKASKGKLASLQERTLPAVLMLLFVGSIAKFLKEDGLILLIFVLQAGMYQEMTQVVGGDFPHPFYKWWWYLTAAVAWNLPRMFPFVANEIALASYGMTSFGILSSIIRFNWRGAQAEEFRDFLRQAAVSVLSALLVIVPSAFWIAILEDFGMKWVGLPALLVIINDTMAYLFGITLGRNPLLPTISPKKTWEGFVGATLSTSAAAYFLLESRRDAIVLGLATSMIGPFGGFLASMIKRAYSQKDFGTFIPGHGGFIDRLDCQLILAPLVFLYLTLTKAE